MSDLATMLAMPDLATSMTSEILHEAVLCFDDEADAAAFSDALFAERGQAVDLAAVDSHALFRMTSESRAAVVLVGLVDGCLPRPSELMAELRQKRSWDE